MPTLVMDPQIEEQLLADRRAWGGDKFDEVWDGVYVMAPLANIEHQAVVGGLCFAIASAFAATPAVRVFPGINVSDRRKGWEKNYRCPDVAVILPGSKAVDCGPYLLGGPDFVVEVASDYDRSREKFDFYSRVAVCEMLLVDRKPWQLELYRLVGTELKPAGSSDAASQEWLVSEVLNLSFRLVAAQSGRPQIEVVRPETSLRWLI